MGKYIKLFNTHVEYENARQNLILPNVSLCTQEAEVHYNPFDPYNGHPYVEIGGLKWATMNVGATSETDYGLYFQWGDTQGYTASQVGSGEGQKYFGWSDYKWTEDEGLTFTKYNNTDGKTVLDIEDDAVRANWGGAWRMPTTEEFQALGNAVDAVWTTDYNGSGVNGLLCTDKSDSTKTLFFPAAGIADNGSVSYVGDECGVKSSSLLIGDVINSLGVYFSDGLVIWGSESGRCYGVPVRGVVG